MRKLTKLTESKYSRALSCFLRRRGEESFTDRWFSKHAAELLPSDEVSLLSIGCGAGVFDLKVMDTLASQKKHIAYVGVDPNYNQINRFHRSFGERSFENVSLKLENCRIEDFHTTERFNLVHFTHCLYHIHDCFGSIQKTIKFLRPQGKIVIFNDDPVGIQQIRSKLCELMNVQSHHLFSYEDLGRTAVLAGITYGVERSETFIDVTPCFDNDCDESEMLLSFLVDADFKQLPGEIQEELRKYLLSLCIKRNGNLFLPHQSWVLVIDG